MDHDLYESLIDDTSFIDWVNSDFEKSDQKWSDYIDSHPEAFDTINKAIHTVRSLRGESFIYPDKEVLLSKIENTTGNNVFELNGSNSRRLTSLKLFAYAASFLGILMISAFIFGNKKYQTATGEQLVVNLPDQSKAILNAGSSLTYNAVLWNMQRSVNMQGEAFFEVKKGKKFDVVTPEGKVSVLGTSFHVESRLNFFDVFCYTGKVAVEPSVNDQKYVLNPNQGVQVKNNEILKTKGTAKSINEPLWRNNQEHFENATLIDIIPELQKYFDQKLVLSKDIQNDRFTGFIPVNNIDTALQHITWPLGLQFKKEENQIYIYK